MALSKTWVIVPALLAMGVFAGATDIIAGKGNGGGQHGGGHHGGGGKNGGGGGKNGGGGDSGPSRGGGGIGGSSGGGGGDGYRNTSRLTKCYLGDNVVYIRDCSLLAYAQPAISYAPRRVRYVQRQAQAPEPVYYQSRRQVRRVARQQIYVDGGMAGQGYDYGYDGGYGGGFDGYTQPVVRYVKRPSRAAAMQQRRRAAKLARRYYAEQNGYGYADAGYAQGDYYGGYNGSAYGGYEGYGNGGAYHGQPRAVYRTKHRKKRRIVYADPGYGYGYGGGYGHGGVVVHYGPAISKNAVPY